MTHHQGWWKQVIFHFIIMLRKAFVPKFMFPVQLLFICINFPMFLELSNYVNHFQGCSRSQKYDIQDTITFNVYWNSLSSFSYCKRIISAPFGCPSNFFWRSQIGKLFLLSLYDQKVYIEKFFFFTILSLKESSNMNLFAGNIFINFFWL